MSQALEKLLNLLQPEQLDSRLFRADCEELGLPQVFGGQVVGQAMCAAQQTTNSDRHIHSFHSYFLRPGDSRQSIIYDVEILRDGRSLSARRVKAIQNGVPIFFMTASFQAAAEGFEHQTSMPEIRGPEGLPNEQQLAAQLFDKIPEKLRPLMSAERPLEFRPVQLHNPLQGHISEPVRQVWIRANGKLPDNQTLHQYLLGYASDFNFLPVALQPHGKGFLEPEMQVATIDHSMWFHRPVNLNEWLLYSVNSPSASGSRGFVRGEFYSQEGQLLASAVQEGVIRVRNK